MFGLAFLPWGEELVAVTPYAGDAGAASQPQAGLRPEAQSKPVVDQ